MPIRRLVLAAAVACMAGVPAAFAESTPPPAPTMADIIARSSPDDWRRPDPDNVLYLELASGRVVIELAPQFAPRHAENIRALARQDYWDGLAILRSQDNYVVQWGDPDAGSDTARTLGKAASKLPSEFDSGELSRTFVPLRDADPYARQAGWVASFPAGHDTSTKRTWLAHCYGAVGAGRGNEADSSTGAELYVVIGHAPRHLDRNIAVVGRVISGIEHLSSLPRGTGALGFYESEGERVQISSIRLASDLPVADQPKFEYLSTESESFARYADARANRRDPFFIKPAGGADICNIPVPIRPVAAK